MKKTISIVSVAAFYLASGVSQGYDLETHAEMSRHAFSASSAPALVRGLGLTEFSLLNVAAIRRPAFNTGTPLGWVREGAVLEDGDGGCDPRPRQHFYNPLNNTGYSFGLVQGIPSADWGLEDRGEISDQSFSYTDAKNYLWAALRPTSDADRRRDLALTFRSLGQVIHLVQDAAQPQHTRNDSHAGSCAVYLAGPTSLYELYVEDSVPRLDYSGYANVSLARPRDYWDDETGRGIAEFSNRSFVSAGTNFTGTADTILPARNFPRPDGAGAVVVAEDIQSLLPGAPLHGTMRFVSTPFEDRYSGETAQNPHTSSYSIFTPELRRRGFLQHFTLNRFNYEAAQKILVPRAVGYSAGLINHFFRGKIEIDAPDDFVYATSPYAGGKGSFTRLRMKVRNDTANEDANLGTIQAVLRYRAAAGLDPVLDPLNPAGDLAYAVSAAQEIRLGRDSQPIEFDFQAQPIPAAISDVSLIVAFRGPLTSAAATEDDAILIGAKDLFEPELVAFGNATDYECYRDALYDTAGRSAAQRDVNGDGTQDLFGPWIIWGNYVRLAPTPGPWIIPSSANATFRVPLLYGAELTRFVVLQDQPAFRLFASAENATDTSTGAQSSLFAYGDFPGSVNRFVEQNGWITHEVNYLPTRFRAVPATAHAHWLTNAVLQSAACRQIIQTAPRAMLEVAGSVG